MEAVVVGRAHLAQVVPGREGAAVGFDHDAADLAFLGQPVEFGL